MSRFVRRVAVGVVALAAAAGALTATAAPDSAGAAPSSNYSAAAGCVFGNRPATLEVKHRYDLGPYIHSVVWINNNTWYAQRERLWVLYPGRTWTLVWDAIQDEAPSPDYWAIFYTPSYRPGDNRYWKIVLWAQTSSPGGVCDHVESNVVYD